jgi:hypothetical protein
MENNGRINIKQASTEDLFAMYDKIPAHQCSTFRNPLQGVWDETALSQAFFSKENMQILQNGIRKGVYTKSNGQYVVSTQDCEQLQIILRSIFLQNAIHKDAAKESQLIALNDLVLNYCIHQVYSEAQGYIKYRQDISSLPVPIQHPILSSSKSSNPKQLELKHFF